MLDATLSRNWSLAFQETGPMSGNRGRQFPLCSPFFLVCCLDLHARTTVVTVIWESSLIPKTLVIWESPSYVTLAI